MMEISGDFLKFGVHGHMFCFAATFEFRDTDVPSSTKSVTFENADVNMQGSKDGALDQVNPFLFFVRDRMSCN